jgi:hypothetical protein
LNDDTPGTVLEAMTSRSDSDTLSDTNRTNQKLFRQRYPHRPPTLARAGNQYSGEGGAEGVLQYLL